MGDLCISDKIIHFFDSYAKYNEELGIDMVRHLYNSNNKMFITEGRYMQALLHEIIMEAIEKGEVNLEISYTELAEQLFVIARGVLFDWCLHDREYNLREYMKSFMERMLKSLSNMVRI